MTALVLAVAVSIGIIPIGWLRAQPHNRKLSRKA